MAFLMFLYVFGNLDSFGEASKIKNSKIDVKKNRIWKHFDFLGESQNFPEISNPESKSCQLESVVDINFRYRTLVCT